MRMAVQWSYNSNRTSNSSNALLRYTPPQHFVMCVRLLSSLVVVMRGFRCVQCGATGSATACQASTLCIPCCTGSCVSCYRWSL